MIHANALATSIIQTNNSSTQTIAGCAVSLLGGAHSALTWATGKATSNKAAQSQPFFFLAQQARQCLRTVAPLARSDSQLLKHLFFLWAGETAPLARQRQ